MPDRREIRVSVDYGYEWPLEEGGVCDISPQAFDLSPELTQRLRTWLDFWESHFDFGWDTPEHEDEWFRDGRTVSWELRLEVAEIADVILDIDWCRSDRGSVHR